jgi:PAT family beta-lactamase induction signal transducer AmpG
MLSSSGGWLADQMDWVSFFIVTTGAALPGLVLLVWITRRFSFGTNSAPLSAGTAEELG